LGIEEGKKKMAYQVSMRIEPLTMKKLAAVQAHNKREFTEPHVNSERSHLNRVYAGSGDLAADMQAIIDKYGMNDKRSTKVAAEMILTANHEWFESIGEKRTEQWIEKNVQWLKNKYGDALVSCDLHLDEKAPHIHAVVAAKATYTKRFRHGEKEVTRVAYNKVFGDDRKTIAQARANNNSELTKLGRLQTEYADAMSEFGLERGQFNAFTKHVTPKEYREKLSKDSAKDRPKKPPILKKPELSKTEKLKEVISGDKTSIEKWAERSISNAKLYTQRLERYVSEKEKAAEKGEIKTGIAYKATRTVTGLRDEIRSLKGEVKMLREQLSKEQVNTLRKIPVSLVAEATNYDGEIDKKKHRNAIDFLIDTEEMSYDESILFLHDNFSSEEAQDTIRQFWIDNANPLSDLREAAKAGANRLSKQEYAIQQEMKKQLAALDADEYRVTLTKEGSGINLGKRKDDTEYKYSADELTDGKVIRMLNVKNYKEKYNVFVTPFSSKYDYFFVDDMTAKSKQQMLDAGYEFAMLSESSPGNTQGILKVEKGEHTREQLNSFFKALNNEYGDKKICAQIHPFRLAGFQNMKPKHEQNGRRPFVKLLEHTGKVCEYAKQKIKEMFAPDVDNSNIRPASKVFAKFKSLPKPERIDTGDRAAEADDRIYAQTRYDYIEQTYADPDLSRADYMVARDLAKRGLDANSIKDLVREFSPNLDARKADVEKYLDRTVEASSRYTVQDYSQHNLAQQQQQKISLPTLTR